MTFPNNRLWQSHWWSRTDPRAKQNAAKRTKGVVGQRGKKIPTIPAKRLSPPKMQKRTRVIFCNISKPLPLCHVHSIPLGDLWYKSSLSIETSGLSLLELERSNIYLYPLPANHPQWIREKYEKYEKKEPLSDEDVRLCQGIKARGGMHPPLTLSISIVGSSLD